MAKGNAGFPAGITGGKPGEAIRAMAVEYLKKATKTAETSDSETGPIVVEMLARIEAEGEAAVRAYAEKLDGWNGDIVVSEAALA